MRNIDFSGDTVVVAAKYQNWFNQALTDVFGANKLKNFSYNDEGILSFDGDTKGMSKIQRNVFKDFNKVLTSNTIGPAKLSGRCS